MDFVRSYIFLTFALYIISNNAKSENIHLKYSLAWSCILPSVNSVATGDIPSPARLAFYSMDKKRWSKKELCFLKENYRDKGAQYCANALNVSKDRITNKSFHCNLHISRKTESRIKTEANKKELNDYDVHPDKFLNICTPEVAYFLGVFWTDGNMSSRKIVKSYNIRINCILPDAFEYKIPFDRIGKWKFYIYPARRGPKGGQSQGVFSTSNFFIYDFLKKNSALNKSFASPDKLLKKIPRALRKYFFRGIIDGDGCFFYKKHTYQFSIASTYEQNWKYIQELFRKLDITKYAIQRRVDERSKSSCIRISNRMEIRKLGDYIYENYEVDKIGLSRKYNKFLLIKSVRIEPFMDLNEAKSIVKLHNIKKISEYIAFTKTSSFFVGIFDSSGNFDF